MENIIVIIIIIFIAKALFSDSSGSSSNANSAKINKDKNRCSGCEYYDGFNGKYVKCEIGKTAEISKGCSSFTPDDTATCEDCYYMDKRTASGGYHCRFRNKEYFMPETRCSDYAENW